MLIQTLLNEATDKDVKAAADRKSAAASVVDKAPKHKSGRPNLTHIAPSFHDSYENKYANVVKYIRILAHAAQVSLFNSDVSVTASEIKFSISLSSVFNSEKITPEEKIERYKEFMTGVIDYFSKIKNATVYYTDSGLMMHTSKKDKRTLLKSGSALKKEYMDLLDADLKIFKKERHPAFAKGAVISFIVVPDESVKQKSAHDYDAISKHLIGLKKKIK